jgi:diguanylate cyclase (GGDEF)-like protein
MKHVLIVDDDVITNNSIKAILSGTYRVSQLTSGKQVIEFLKAKKTDLILLDIYMHDMNGIEVIQHIKADKSLASIPVIFLTSDVSEETEARCLQLGAVDYVHKPISRQALEQRVENHIMAAESYERVRQMYESASHEARTSREKIRHDELTGLWNRQHVYEEFSILMSRSDAQCSLAFIDMDNFKSINDIFGHQEGDALLRRFAGILSELEKNGIIPARIGGDEFMLLMPGQVNPASIQDMSDYLFQRSSRQVLPQAEPGAVTFSMGVAFAPEDGADFESVAALADMALRKAKSLGKNRVYFARNLNIRSRQREHDLTSSMTSLEHLMQGRRSDRGALVIQFGEMRILYLSLKRMPPEISDNIRAVMLTVAPEDCNPFDSGRLMHAVCEKMEGVTTAARYSQNQIIALVCEPDAETLKNKFAALTESGGYGKIKVEVI